jgi:predicted Zn-dependent peptidase
LYRGENRLYEYVDKVKATTPRKVQAAAASLLNKPYDSMVTMIIGDAGSIIPDLSKAFPDNMIVPYVLSD